MDHAHAKALESALKELTWVKEVVPVDTNIVVPILHEGEKRDVVIAKLAERGIKIMAFGPGMLRFVTHLDVSAAMIDETIQTLKELRV